VPLLLAAPLSAGLLSLDAGQLRVVELGLLLGTPGLAAIGVTIAALTAGLRAGAALGLLAIPLAVPLIFGAGSLQPGGEGGLLLLAATSLAALAIAPRRGRGHPRRRE
jgi:heme exporter protein B